MIKYQKYTIICALLFVVVGVYGYGLPNFGLGLSNILDGGPVRPNPGIYWQHWLQYYTTQRFLNNQGKSLNNVCSPHFRGLEYVTQFVYQFEKQMRVGAMPGLEVALPLSLVSKIDKDNALNLESSGAGFGNASFGAYLQWPALFHNGRHIFVHRLEFTFAIPLGKNELPEKQINPSNPFFSCGPNWSATLYLSHTWALSWRLNYAWCAKNEKIDFRAGDAIFGHYSLSYEPCDRFYVAAVGYFLQQLHNNKALGVTVPDSKERIFGIGPGIAYFHTQDLIFFSYLYLEAGVRNRTQGTKFVSRLVLHF
jgi:hypothetical protein